MGLRTLNRRQFSADGRTRAVASHGKTQRNLSRHFFSARQVLCISTTLFVLFVASPLPVSAATRVDHPFSNIGQRERRTCLDTKSLESGRISTRYPSCWTLSNYSAGSTMTTVLDFLSNQPMHNPCSTMRSGTETTSSCGFPVKTLEHGGVLVMLILGGMPGWKISSQTGHHLMVDHRAARESVTRNSAGSLHATNEV